MRQAEERVADLLLRLKAAMGMDATTAAAALSWIGRAETSEKLVAEVLQHVTSRQLNGFDLPRSWVARAEAQQRSVAILKRDQAALAERPPDGTARALGSVMYDRNGQGQITGRRRVVDK